MNFCEFIEKLVYDLKIAFVFLAKLCFYASWSCAFNQHVFLGVLIKFVILTTILV